MTQERMGRRGRGARERLLAIACAVAALVAAAAACGDGSDVAVPVDDRPTLRWFVGLGTGASEEQRAVQQSLVDRYNERQDRVRVEVEVWINPSSRQQLDAYIAADDLPDVLGPMGVTSTVRYRDILSPLDPDAGLVDLADFGLGSLDSLQLADGRLLGVPIGVFPSVMAINTAMFDAAGLPYPPQEYGADYRGAPWTWDALRSIARELTLDVNQVPATDDAFDPGTTVQWGFSQGGLTDPSTVANLHRGAGLYDESGEFGLPEAWRDAIRWYHEMVVDDHSAPSSEEVETDLIDTGGYKTGSVAMGYVMGWEFPGIADAPVGATTRLAVIPTTPGLGHPVSVDADSFHVTTGSDHPDEAWRFVDYLLTTSGAELVDLLLLSDAFPAANG